MHRGVTRSWEISPRIFMEDIYPKADSQGHLNGNFPWNFSSWKCQDSMAHGEFGTWNLQEEHPTGDTLWGQDPAPGTEQPKSTILMVVAAALSLRPSQGWKSTGGIPEPDSKADENGEVVQHQYLLLMEKNIRRFTSWYGKLSHYLRCFYNIPGGAGFLPSRVYPICP